MIADISIDPMSVQFVLNHIIVYAYLSSIMLRVLPITISILPCARYNNMNAVLLFIPAMIVTGEVSNVLTSPLMLAPHFWVMLTIAGLFGLILAVVYNGD